jgi:mono/diheme cytochrome c family protein
MMNESRWLGIRPAAVLSVAGAFALLSMQGCERGMKNMYAQDKYSPLAASETWSDGRSARPLPAGTVPYSAGIESETSSGARGEKPLVPKTHADFALSNLQRGRQRYDIFCAPCHGMAGDGNGYVVQRGFPRPPSFHIDRLRSADDAYLYEVATHGHGVMYGYGDRVDENDRWAIVGYLRALQLADNARIENISPPAQRQLAEISQ